MPTTRRQAAPSRTVVVASTAQAYIAGAAIHADLTTRKPVALDVAYPLSASDNRVLKLSSGGPLSLTLRDATDVPAEYANGFLVYRGGMRAGAHVIVRPLENGFEDYFFFENKPDTNRVEYDLAIPPTVAGLRLTSNILELVGANGLPLVHASAPFFVDSAGVRTSAKMSIAGCAFDASVQPTWNRRPTAPGATSCKVSITWDDANVQYPAVLDPTWESASAMPVSGSFYNSELLAARSPQQIVAFGFADAGGPLNTTLFFDVDSATWSVGPPSVVPLYGASSVSFNNDNTNGGAQIFASGGYAPGADGSYTIQPSTEILSMNAAGQWAWKASAPMHSARTAHTATAIPTATGSQILLAGGAGVGPYANGCDVGATAVTAELYDTSTGSFVSPPPPNLPVSLWGATAALSADRQAVIIVSGYNGQTDTISGYCSASSQVFAFRAGQWLTLPSMPIYRLGPRVVQLKDGRLMAAGGIGYTDATQASCEAKSDTQLFTYSPTAPYGSWTTADLAPVAGIDGSLVTLSNGAVMAGPIGVAVTCNNPSTPTTQVELFDPQTGHWSRTTDAAQPHFSAVPVAVVKSTGEHEVVVFGGATALNATHDNWTYTESTEIFTLTSDGQPCTTGPECATGICVGSLCQPPGFPITIDATALSNKGASIPGVLGGAVFDTMQPRQLSLVAGTYNLHPVSGVASLATFTVKSDGTVAYDPSLEGVLSGNGGTTLKVNGRTITVDATPLSEPQLALLAYHYQAGAEVDQLPFATNTKQTFTLLPLADFGYQFDVDGNHLAAFTFNVDLSGNVLIPSDELILARGSGGSLLRLGGAHVSLTIPTGLGSAVLGGDVTIPEGTTTSLQLLPYAGGSSMSFTIAGQTATLSVNAAGYLDGDALLLHVLQVQGDGAPFCDAEYTQSEASGWAFTPIDNCAGPPQQAGSGYIDAATVAPTVTSRINGAGRPPSMLPRNRRPAGGDPVLGDGEFLIDRTDVSLAGLGIHYEFHRSYRSGNENDGPLSPGWDHNYDQRILGQVIGNTTSPDFQPIFFGDEIGANCDGTVQYQDGDGSIILFTQVKWGYDANGIVQYFAGPTPDVTLEFHHSFVSPLSTVWRLVRNDGQITAFDRAGFLSSITDPAGNSLTFGWSRATPPAAPSGVDCPAIGYSTKACSNWIYGLIKTPIGQRRRLLFASDAARTVYYVYSQTNTELINTNDRLACVSLSDNCTAQVLTSFGYDASGGRLSNIRHGAPTVAVFESYQYHAVGSDSPYCRPSAELPDYCHRLCDDKVPGQCANLGYAAQVAGKCAATYCSADPAECESIASLDSFAIRRGTGLHAPSICCTTLTPNKNVEFCEQFLWDGPNCVDGCENEYQCTTIVEGQKEAAYADSIGQELNNEITDVLDNKGALVVHNDYGEDRTLVSFDKVVKQTLGSASTDNVIAFEYHDLAIEADGAPVYNDTSGLPKWAGNYSTPDPTVQKYVRDKSHALEICPTICGPGGVACAPYDYGPPVEQAIEINAFPMSFATVIHDLHGRTRIQYLDPNFNVLKEVALDTGDVTEFNYENNLLSGELAPSGMRTCLERDAAGHVTQASTVAAPNHLGTSTTQVTTYGYYPNGQLSDEIHDIFGRAARTHYERDGASRVTRIDQDVDSGVQVHTILSYDGETLPTGVLETPTSITYPGQRQDRFSQFDSSLGGPRSIIIDATNATPQKRYAIYDSFGRVTETGEVGRFAQRFRFTDADDIWRLTITGHQLDSTKPWVDTTVQSHVVDGATITDSTAEPTRTTSFTNVGRFPIEMDLVATSAPTGTTLPPKQTTCFNYDPDGRLDAAILPEGNGLAYSYAYDAEGTSVEQRRGFGVDTSGAWAAGCRGHVAPPKDPGMGVSYLRHFLPGGFIDFEFDDKLTGRRFVTDGFGRILSVTSMPNSLHPDPMPIQQFGYDSAGHRVWEATRTPGTAYGHPTLPDTSVLAYAEYDYDLSGRVRHQRSFVLETGEVLTKSFDYDDVAGTVKITDRGVATTETYDGRGRLLRTSFPDTSATTIVHGVGVDTATIQSNSKGSIVRTFNYDTRGLLLNVQNSTGALLYQGTYDDDGNQQTETRAGLGQVTWTYDAFDRLVTEAKVISATVTATSRYEYDGDDRLTAYYDAENSNGGNPWKMTFTGADAPLTVIDPLLRSGSYDYPATLIWPIGLAATVREPNGRVSSYAYDSQARVIDVYNGDCGTTRSQWECKGSAPLQSQRHLIYDVRGNVAQIDAPSPRPSVYLTYDSVGRLVDDKVGIDSLVHHSFLDQGRTLQTQVSYGTNFATMTHRYDDMGRLQTVQLAGQTTPLATYGFGTGAGGPLSLAYSNGATAAYSYDDKLRQTGIDVTFTMPGTTTSMPVTSLHEAFGADSIARMRQHRIGSQAPLMDVFQVDQQGRIGAENLLQRGLTLPSGEIGNSDVSASIQSGNAWRAYDLDTIGNIKQRRMKSATLVHVVDKLSRLTKLGNANVPHDSTDNLLGAQGDPVQFSFDKFTGTVQTARSGAASSTFTYDALDRRRGEHRSSGNSDQLYVWDGNQLVVHGTANDLTLDVPGDDIDSHIVSIDQFGTGSQWFYHQGPDQSTLAVTGSAGLVEAYTYSAFGELSIWTPAGRARPQSTFGNIFQFQGQVFDATTATYSMRARQYQPSWGRFLSPDPLGTVAGPSLYAFAGSEPLSQRDPSGMLPENWHIPTATWMAEWMGTWNPTPGSAGAQFLFAPESQVQGDLEQQLLGRLNAYAGVGISYYLLNGEVHKTVDGVENVKATNVGSGTSDSGSTPFHIDLVVGTVTSLGGRLYPTDRVFAGPVGWVVRLLANGGEKVVKKIWSKEEARILRKQGANIVMKRRQLINEVEKAARNGAEKDILRHKGHLLPNDQKGRPHFQTEGIRGHGFWGKVKSILGLVTVDKMLEFLDPADPITGETAGGNLDEHGVSSSTDAD